MFKWSCFDMTMNIMPAFILSMIQLFTTTVLLVLHGIFMRELSVPLLQHYLYFFAFGYGILFLVGIIALITEWKKIHCAKWKAVLHIFTFPVFMLTYIPISLVALFTHVEWQPIEHKHAMDADEIENQDKKDAVKQETGDGDQQ